MFFYNGELRNFNLHKMQEDVGDKFFAKICNNSICFDLEINKNNEEDIINILKENKQLYYFFGKREGKYLSCINGKKYIVDDERSKNSKGIFMADAYFNEYDDINLGFLLSYDNGKVNIQPAIEGEGIKYRICEVVENCGDLYNEMKVYLNEFII